MLFMVHLVVYVTSYKILTLSTWFKHSFSIIEMDYISSCKLHNLCMTPLSNYVDFIYCKFTVFDDECMYYYYYYYYV